MSANSAELHTEELKNSAGCCCGLVRRLRRLFTRSPRHTPGKYLAEQTLCQTQDRGSPAVNFENWLEPESEGGDQIGLAPVGLESKIDGEDRDGSVVDLKDEAGSKDRTDDTSTVSESKTEDGDRDGRASTSRLNKESEPGDRDDLSADLDIKAEGLDRVSLAPAGTEGEAAGEDRVGHAPAVLENENES